MYFNICCDLTSMNDQAHHQKGTMMVNLLQVQVILPKNTI